MAVAKRNNHSTARRMEMKNIYETEEWKSLPIAERSYLLPAMEDVRPGAMLYIKDDSKASALEKCLEGKGMKVSREGMIWFVSKDLSILNTTMLVRSLYKEAENIFTPEEKQHNELFAEFKNLYHKALEEFFAYPNCYIDNFIDTNRRGISTGQEWYKKAGEALKENNYNDLFDYVFHAPCSLECKNTLEIAEKIKRCLETYDKEAAENLRVFNRGHTEEAAKKF